MTLWLFGDSFALMNWEKKVDLRSWPEILGKKLNQDVKILGRGATGPEWMFYMVNNHYDQFKQNDVIVICFSSEYRHWYLFREPQISTIHVVERILNGEDTWLKLSEEEAKAIEMSSLYLNNPGILETSTQLFLRALNNLSKEKNIKIIIMSFSSYIKEQWKEQNSNCLFVEGTLLESSLDEFCDVSIAPLADDVRAAHYSYRNHNVLADKLEDCILYNKNFHLNRDLLKGFINESNYYDNDFRLQEFMFKPNYLNK